MEKWKIAIDARSAHSLGGGVPNYSRGLINALSKYRDSYEFVFVIESGSPLDHITFPAHSQFYITDVKKNSRLTRDVWENTLLPKRLQQMGVHLYHGLDYDIPLIKTPFLKVSTIHDMTAFTAYDGRPWISKFRVRLLISYVTRRANKVITGSEFSRTEIIHYTHMSSKDIEVIWDGIDHSFFEPCDKQIRNDVRMKLNGYDRFVLYYGGFRKNKNVEVLLRAFSVVAERTRIGLVLVGRVDAYAEALKKLVRRLSLQDRVVFFGFASVTELKYLLYECELFVFPSLMEGFGLPVAEAMACGAPVICSEAASLPEIGGEAAWYFRPHDYQDCANRMMEVLENDDLRLRLRERGKKRKYLFTWEKSAESLICVYEKLLHQHFGSAYAG